MPYNKSSHLYFAAFDTFRSSEIPLPPSETSSLGDRDGENLDEDIVYVYDSENYDDDEDDRVTDGDDDMIDSGECFLAEGLTEEQVCIFVEEFFYFRCFNIFLHRCSLKKDTPPEMVSRDLCTFEDSGKGAFCVLIISMIGWGN